MVFAGVRLRAVQFTAVLDVTAPPLNLTLMFTGMLIKLSVTQAHKHMQINKLVFKNTV
jgi:hypothetical protein